MAESVSAPQFATNPLAQPQAQPSVLQQAASYGQIAQQKIAIDQAKFNLANDHYTRLQQTLGGLASDPTIDPATVKQNPQAALDAATGHVQNLVKMGLLDPNGAAQTLTQFPTVQQLQQNPAALKNFTEGQLNQAAGNQEQFNRTYGVNTSLNTGGNVLTGNISPQTGAFRPSTSIANTLSPEAKTTTQDQVTPSGASQAIPKSALYDQYGNLRPGALTGQVPTAGIPTSLAPGVSGARGTVAETSGKQLASDTVAADSQNYLKNITPLQTAIPLLEKLGPGSQGAVGQYKADIGRLYQSFVGKTPTNDPVKDFDELHKYLTSEAQSNGDSGTNDKLAATFASNPSTNMSSAGAVDVAKTIVAQKRMQQAKVVGYNGAPEDYSNYSKTFLQKNDPRAFGFDMLNGTQQRNLLKSLSDTDKAKFANSLRLAKTTGVLNQPTGAPQ